MGVDYLDTSALAKLYIREAGTDVMLRLVADRAAESLALLALAPVELRAAIRRRERMGDIPTPDADAALARFAEHLRSQFMVQPVTSAVIDRASDLIDRRALKAYDALQLAGCLMLQGPAGDDTVRFVASDLRLIEIAREEGVQTLNPAEPAPE